MKGFGLSSVAVACLTTVSAGLSPINHHDTGIIKRQSNENSLGEALIEERAYHGGHHHARHPAHHGQGRGNGGKRAGGRFGGGRNKGGGNGNGAGASSAVAPAAASAAASGSATAGGGTTAGDTGDEQSSLTLSPDQVQQGYKLDGQQTPADGQVASATSSNNYINFCATVPNLPLTNGAQVKTGSCNAAPMGVIAATTNMPSAKFQNPANLDDLQPNTDFNIDMAIINLEAGNFVNAASNYYSAPQTVNGNGDIVGHSHFVIQEIPSLTSTDVPDPGVFAFFKGVNDAAVNGVLTEAVAGGLPAGTYKLSSINSAANHQPCLVAVAQHGSLDDVVYFTVGQGQGAGAAAASAAGGGGAGTSSSIPATPAASSVAATGNNNGGGGKNGGRFGGKNNNKRTESAPILRESLLRKRLAALEAQAQAQALIRA